MSAHARAADAPLVSLRGVGKVFDNGVRALESLDLDVREGETLTLLGPSGCGKSTALRMIAGLARPSEGEVVWRDAAQPEIGFVFQEPTLMPWASVEDNVWLPLRLRGVSKSRAQDPVREALERVGLGDFAHSLPRELSGGMKMRVSIARALAAKPKLLLLDEPFAALDEITRNQLNDDLLRLWREEALTILFVTHSVAESCYLAERVLVMTPRPGRLAADIALPKQATRAPGFRLSPQFLDCQRLVSDALGKAS